MSNKKPRYYGLFYGGYNYSGLFTYGDIEEFKSIKDAKETMECRGGQQDRYFPCVEDDAEIHLFVYSKELENDIEASDKDDYFDGAAYQPDLILGFGPRGGVRRMY